MTLTRKQLVAVKDTPYYPVVSLGVRRSYLCGLRTVFAFYSHSLPSIFVAMRPS
jgi:hypothetical protein